MALLALGYDSSLGDTHDHLFSSFPFPISLSFQILAAACFT